MPLPALFAALLATVSAVLVVGPAFAAGLPSCAGPIEASNVRIMRVENNGDLILTDGRAVRLEGVVLPAGSRDGAPSFFAGQAISALSDLSLGRAATLSVFAPKEDRYGRLRAQVFLPRSDGDLWLQLAMLKRGLARVSIAPERRECASALYGAEAEARRKRSGIWISPAYAVRTSGDMSDTVGTFQVVEGKVLTAAVSNGRAYLDFGRDRHKDFKVTIDPSDMKRFREVGVDPRTYEGLTIRVRGYVEWMGGPEIEASSPQSIEVAQPD